MKIKFEVLRVPPSGAALSVEEFADLGSAIAAAFFLAHKTPGHYAVQRSTSELMFEVVDFETLNRKAC